MLNFKISCRAPETFNVGLVFSTVSILHTVLSNLLHKKNIILTSFAPYYFLIFYALYQKPCQLNANRRIFVFWSTLAEVLLSLAGEGEGEEDFTDSDSVITGADSPELADSVPDKDNMR